MPLLVLAAAFFITAILYASIGFGGGSTYTALLAASGLNYVLVPILALVCNLLVVSSNTLRYTHQNLILWRRLLPLLLLSVPAAYAGGRLSLSEPVFTGLLAITLLVAGLKLLLTRNQHLTPAQIKISRPFSNAILGLTIGFLSGLVGIGGGIFLAPALHFLNWGTARHIAAACSVFILANSLAGLAGHAVKLGSTFELALLTPYWPLLIAVLIGGVLGNALSVFKFSEILIKRLTGALIITVACRLLWRWAGLF